MFGHNRAAHIKVSYSLDTDSFLLALRSLIARRGQVKEIGATNAIRAIQKRRSAVTPQMKMNLSKWVIKDAQLSYFALSH